jgi:hypothetical protein
MAARRQRSGVEWVGGVITMPAYVSGEGEPYRPDVLLWLGADGVILGSVVARPDELLGQASASLQEAIERPLAGRAHRPTRVRVASRELAEALRAGHPGIELVHAPTPEIDAVLAAMRAKLAEDNDSEPSYLSPEVGPEAMARLFRAAAALFRAKPWQTVPSGQSLLSVTIEKLGMKDAAMSVIGQMGQSAGLILFSSVEDFEAYLAADEARMQGDDARIPPHLALHFERGAEHPAALHEEIAEHRWEVAVADAFPSLLALDEDLIARPPTAKDVTIAEAVALALPELLREKKALLAAWEGGEAVSRTLTVRTHIGDVEVTLRAPCERDAPAYRPPYDLLAGLAELGRGGGEFDREACQPLERELLRRFAASPEAKASTEVSLCHLLMDLAAEHFGATIATLRAPELQELVFELIPRHVRIDPPAASWIIEDSRAFFALLGRELGLPQADACLRVLAGDAAQRLEAALSDMSKFSMAKSFFMGGREAGFDMDSREGIEGWMRVVQSQPLPSPGAPRRPVGRVVGPPRKRAARKPRKKGR